MSTLDPMLLELTLDAAVKAYWYKKPFRAFLSNCGISQSHLAALADETKRDFLDRTFVLLKKDERGRSLLRKMALTLSEKEEFPDLMNIEDSAQRLKDARESVAKLKRHLAKEREKEQEERDRIAARKRAADLRQQISNRQQSLQSLEERLSKLSQRIGQQGAGYEFEKWFYDLVDFFEIPCRRPYKVDGRQIDGSITVDGTTYLIELKFTAEQASATDIDTFIRKVQTKADNTMGVMVSISGYSSTAIAEASRERTVILLLDHSHLYMALRDILPLGEVVKRVRRHAAQTGKAYLSADNFGG